ncbi:ankyrin repeat domain-containing protein [Wolbachia endosymbiont of Listronotus oregonensis]|uniref:ankyrin repeat domain-containing protein n=1 Tax=Wolbachia endosymbiont of Listronotus oregonensis TaxID=2969106 RepID=UPI00281681E6|nr:ankyrin repeat domain-containing protein [Wolbachia endosymbiont of Listronotus oregonensis]WMT84105.1 ankyrin repeat domain-containing protein [Wolbachia endosymbiont of Listronotus oregonensis]
MVIQALIGAGANVRAEVTYGLSPLHFAAGNGNLEIVKCLVEAGAGINFCDSCGSTPLHLAAQYGKKGYSNVT